MSTRTPEFLDWWQDMEESGFEFRFCQLTDHSRTMEAHICSNMGDDAPVYIPAQRKASDAEATTDQSEDAAPESTAGETNSDAIAEEDGSAAE